MVREGGRVCKSKWTMDELVTVEEAQGLEVWQTPQQWHRHSRSRLRQLGRVALLLMHSHEAGRVNSPPACDRLLWYQAIASCAKQLTCWRELGKVLSWTGSFPLVSASTKGMQRGRIERSIFRYLQWSWFLCSNCFTPQRKNFFGGKICSLHIALQNFVSKWFCPDVSLCFILPSTFSPLSLWVKLQENVGGGSLSQV